MYGTPDNTPDGIYTSGVLGFMGAVRELEIMGILDNKIVRLDVGALLGLISSRELSQMEKLPVVQQL